MAHRMHVCFVITDTNENPQLIFLENNTLLKHAYRCNIQPFLRAVKMIIFVLDEKL